MASISFVEEKSFPSPYPANLLRTLLQNHAESFFVAEEAGKLLGYCVSSTEAGSAHLLSMAVLSEHRRTGIATALLQRLVEHLKRKGVGSLWLEVNQSNMEAIRLYERFGFVKMMILDNYYSDGSPAVRMWMRIA